MMGHPRVTGVVLHGVDLNTWAGAGGAAWLFTNVRGWFEPAPATVDQSPRTGHGVYGSDGRRGARTVTITGRIQGTREQVGEAIELLAAIGADGQEDALTIVDRTQGARTANVRTLTVDAPWDGSGIVFYVLQVTADLPWKYGGESVTQTGFAQPTAGAGLVFPEVDGVVDFGTPVPPASVILSNPGTATAYPTFRMDQAVDGFRIVDVLTGEPTDFLGAVPDGGWVLIDAARGTALRSDGEDVSTQLRTDRLPEIPRMSQREYLLEPLTIPTAAILTARAKHTYW